jgi:immunoglobulin-binding protein 1
VNKLSLFSSNETLEDIHTNDLPFLLIPAYLSQTLLKTPFHQLELRINSLEKASQWNQLFIDSMRALDLVSKEDEAEYQQWLTKSQTTLSAEQQRNKKIARYKREKELKSRLEVGFIIFILVL